MSKHSTQIERIKKKFNQAKEADIEFKVFGASEHKYQLGRTATQKEVSDFEERYSVELPECYRAFITEFCGSGILSRNKRFLHTIPAPYYGLYSFELYMKPNHRTFDDKLSEILGEEPCMYPNMSDKEWKGYFDTLAQNPVWQELDKKIEETDENYYELSGLLPLGDRGCHYSIALVVVGQYKGRVVYIDESNMEAPFFTYEDNFLDWYERWLYEIIDGTLLQKNVFGFANTMQGSEKELVSKLRHEEDNNIKLSLVESLWKFKTLEDNSIEILFEYLDSDEKTLYYQALALLTKHRYHLIKDELERMIYRDEESCQVAYNMLTLYARKHVLDWVDISLERLKTINERNTFNEITMLLDIAKYDYSKDIVPLQEKEEFKTLVPYTIRQMKCEPIVHQSVSKLHRFYRAIKRVFGR